MHHTRGESAIPNLHRGGQVRRVSLVVGVREGHDDGVNSVSGVASIQHHREIRRVVLKVAHGESDGEGVVRKGCTREGDRGYYSTTTVTLVAGHEIVVVPSEPRMVSTAAAIVYIRIEKVAHKT